MSVIAVAWGAHPDYPLVLLANRDELHTRPSLPAHWWSEAPHCLAGRDQLRGGAWLAVTRDGRFSAVTGYRDGVPPSAEAPSRGQLPLDYLLAEEDPVVHARRFIRNKGDQAPYNLLLGSPRQLHYAATRSRLPLALTPGIHTVANGLMDEPWPKCTWLNTMLGSYILTYGGFQMLLDGHLVLSKIQLHGVDALPVPAAKTPTPAEIAQAGFCMLADAATYDEDLPDTGIDLDEEERLSACFITGENDGTRSSTVLVMAADGHVRFEEISFDPAGQESGRVVEEWNMDPAVFSAGADD
jgi:uncharacterized protein with NRDE domain